MKLRNLFLLSILAISFFSACEQKADDNLEIEALVAVALTQTAAAPPGTLTPTPAKNTGTIKGKVGLMAPPTPAMVVYAWNPATNDWTSIETTANPNGMADFNLEVPPGAYLLFAYEADSHGPASAGYSTDGKVLSPIVVNPNQTIENIMVQFPGQDDCGFMYSIPPSPDGKHPELPGPDESCVERMKAFNESGLAEASYSPDSIRVQFPAYSDNWSDSSSIQPGGGFTYILYALAGQTINISLSFTPDSGAYFFIHTADGIPIVEKSNTNWSGELPANQDCVIGVVNLTQQQVNYTLTVTK